MISKLRAASLSDYGFQLPEKAGGQFFFAKAFDKFAPIGPALTHPNVFKQGEGLGIITRLNGQVVQEAKFAEDLVWKPAELLRLDEPNTPAEVGVFKQPRRLVADGDIVEVEVPNLGTLRNKIIFE
ncbi:hypothetical protein B0J13DRAFT_519965 [Dactylonectria estremocensis]|uniref:Fumarylacetoacetase-like C-terminal domain-containing protein n=1 Tax=Dactylonectria estremocensis TaxID=1079267 RepID=A0A9P9FGB9_9HYPO|nr:hypothetical protein B0J13DRAFT_519965 [Dactylonectria estremocensis]